MKKQELINLIITAEHTIITRDGEINNDYLNICYWILKDKNLFIDDENIIIELYDNLLINNEFITKDNINEYSTDFIEKRTGHKIDYVKNQLNNGYFYLLNYYSPLVRNVYNTLSLIEPSRAIKFKHGYNILIGNEQ